MGNTTSSNPFKGKFKVVHVPEITTLDIPDARYAAYDPEKCNDTFSTIKREFEKHVKTNPEEAFKIKVPSPESGLDEGARVTPYIQYAEKMCKEARRKHWKCDVESFGDIVKILLDKQ